MMTRTRMTHTLTYSLAFTCLSLTCLSQSVRAQCGEQVRRLVASDGHEDAGFGGALAASAGRFLIAAPTNDELGNDAGAAYLFDSASGAELMKLTASDGSGIDYFAFSVGLSGDRAILGAVLDDPRGNASGSAYVFDTVTGNELMKLVAADGEFGDRFGYATAISSTRILVGAAYDDTNNTDTGSVYVYDLATGSQLDWLAPADRQTHDYFGSAVALQGDLAVIGAPGDDDLGYGAGSAYVYDLATGTQLHKLLASAGGTDDEFGTSVAIDGNLIVVGAPLIQPFNEGPGAAYVFDATTGLELAKLEPLDGQNLDGFGWSVDIQGTTVAVGAIFDDDFGPASGTVFLFDASTGVQTRKLWPDNSATGDYFGTVELDGDTLLVGASGDRVQGQAAGAAYQFDLTTPGSRYCDANANSRGVPARISACGSAKLSDNDLTLRAEPLPNSFYLFFYGPNPIQVPFGEGLRCVGGSITRLNPPSVAQGGTVALRQLDLPSAGITQPGTLHFQCWYRDNVDGNSTFNLSDGLTVDFVP